MDDKTQFELLLIHEAIIIMLPIILAGIVGVFGWALKRFVTSVTAIEERLVKLSEQAVEMRTELNFRSKYLEDFRSMQRDFKRLSAQVNQIDALVRKVRDGS